MMELKPVLEPALNDHFSIGEEIKDLLTVGFGIAKHRNQEPSANREVQFMEKLVHYVQENFEDVGTDFAKEALKMHYGVSDPRNIRGVSSEQEEQTLREEGISFFKLPVMQNSDSEEEN